MANSVLAAAESFRDWRLVTRLEGQHRAFDAAALEAVPQDKRDALNALIAEEARAGFQYCFERFPLYDQMKAGNTPSGALGQLAGLLGSDAFTGLLRKITDAPEDSFIDGQLTRYRAGHFLTLHDDEEPDLKRICAYVLNFTPEWNADFGGILQFPDKDGHIAAGFTPKFNSMTVFRVPVAHMVSAVPPFVTRSRYALTGWLRHGPEPRLPVHE
ncbi:MAG: 2OG-Fe(II) oxygenase [Glycocaulis sp.]